MKGLAVIMAATLLASPALAQTCNGAMQRTAPDKRYVAVSGSNGAEILDRQTKLIWRRCSAGQTWDGSTCSGSAGAFDWVTALQQAKAAGTGYRLPNVKELQSLLEAACYTDAINEKFFPASLRGVYWSSTPAVGARAWFVNFNLGDSGNSERFSAGAVRAVRSGK